MSQALPISQQSRTPVALAGLALTLAALLWSYWSTLAETTRSWSTDPQYSHGYLVPVFAAAFLWLRRRQRPRLEAGSTWAGLTLVLGALVLRLVGTWFYFSWLDPVSLLPCLAGLCVLAGGWPLLRWTWPAIAFLFFMIPLPYGVSKYLADPLQTAATQASTYVLQTLGRPAVAEKHVILINEVKLGIVEACSGLRMLVVFFALATAMAMLMRRPLWERIVVVASAIPIALATNIVRITVTGILYEAASAEVAHAVFHDLAGWLMMPLALALLGMEMKVLSRMVLDPTTPAGAGQAESLAMRVSVPLPPGPPSRSRRASRRERSAAAKPFEQL